MPDPGLSNLTPSLHIDYGANWGLFNIEMLVLVLVTDGGAGLPAHVCCGNGGEGKVEHGVVVLSCRFWVTMLKVRENKISKYLKYCRFCCMFV